MLKKLSISLFIALIIGMFFFKNYDKYQIQTGLASINQSNILVYAEPNLKSQKLWKLNHKNWPIFILLISKNWVRITDINNTEGWIQRKYVGKPYTMIIEDTYAFKNYNDIQHNKYAAKLLKNAFIEFIQNNNSNNKYCKIKVMNKIMLVECDKLLLNMHQK